MAMICNEGSPHENICHGTSVSNSVVETGQPSILSLRETDNASKLTALPCENEDNSIFENECGDSDKESGAGVKIDNIKLAYVLQAREDGLFTFRGKGRPSRSKLMNAYKELFLPQVLIKRCDANYSGNGTIYVKRKLKRTLSTDVAELESTEMDPNSNRNIYTANAKIGETDRFLCHVLEADPTNNNSHLDGYRDKLQSVSRNYFFSPLALSGLSNISVLKTDFNALDEPAEFSNDVLKVLVAGKGVDVGKESCQKVGTAEEVPSDKCKSQGEHSASRMLPRFHKYQGKKLKDKHLNDEQNKKLKPRRKLYMVRRRSKWLKGWQRKVAKRRKQVCTGPQTHTLHSDRETGGNAETLSHNKWNIDLCQGGTSKSSEYSFLMWSRNKRPDTPILQNNPLATNICENKLIPDLSFSSKLKIPKHIIKRRLGMRSHSKDADNSQYLSGRSEEGSNTHAAKKRQRVIKSTKKAFSPDGVKEETSTTKGPQSNCVSSFRSEDTRMAQEMLDQTARLASEFNNYNWLETKIRGVINSGIVPDKSGVTSQDISQNLERTSDDKSSFVTCTASSAKQQPPGLVISTQHPSLRRHAHKQPKKKRRKARSLSDSSAQLDRSPRVGPPTTPPNQVVSNIGGILLHPAFSNGTSLSAPSLQAPRPLQPRASPLIFAQPKLNLVSLSNVTPKAPPSRIRGLYPTVEQSQQIANVVPRPASQDGPVTYVTLVQGQLRPPGAQIQLMLLGQPDNVPPRPQVLKQVIESQGDDLNSTELNIVPVTHASRHDAFPFECSKSLEPPERLTVPILSSTTTGIANKNKMVTTSTDISGNLVATTNSVPKTATDVEYTEVEKEVMTTKEDQSESLNIIGTTEPLSLPDIIPDDYNLSEDLLAIKREYEKQKKELEMLFELSRQKEKEKVLINQKTRDTYIKMKTIDNKVKNHYEQQLRKGYHMQISEQQTTTDMPPDKELVSTPYPSVTTQSLALPQRKSIDADESASEHSHKTDSKCIKDTIIDLTNVCDTPSSSSYHPTGSSCSPQRRVNEGQGENPISVLSVDLSIKNNTPQVNLKLGTENPGLAHNLQPVPGIHTPISQSARDNLPNRHIPSDPYVRGSDEANHVFNDSKTCEKKTSVSPGDQKSEKKNHDIQHVPEWTNTKSIKVDNLGDNVTNEAKGTMTVKRTTHSNSKIQEIEILSDKKGVSGGRDCRTHAPYKGKVHPAFPFNEQRQLAPIQRSIIKSNLSNQEKQRRQIELFQMQEQQRILFCRLAAMDPASRQQFVQRNQMNNAEQDFKKLAGTMQVEGNASRQFGESDQDQNQHIQVKCAMELALLQQRMRQIQIELNEESSHKFTSRRKRKTIQASDHEESDSPGPPKKYHKAISYTTVHGIKDVATVEGKQHEIVQSLSVPFNSLKEAGYVLAHTNSPVESISNSIGQNSVHGSSLMPGCHILNTNQRTDVQGTIHSYPGGITSVHSIDTKQGHIDSRTQISLPTPQRDPISGVAVVQGRQPPVFNFQHGQPPSAYSVASSAQPYYSRLGPQIKTSRHPQHQIHPTTPNRQYTPARQPIMSTAANELSVSLSQQRVFSHQARPHIQGPLVNGMISVPRQHLHPSPVQVNQSYELIGQAARPNQMVPGSVVAQPRFQIHHPQFMNKHMSIEQLQPNGFQRFGQAEAHAAGTIFPDQRPRQQIATSALNKNVPQQRLPHHLNKHEGTLQHNSGSHSLINHGGARMSQPDGNTLVGSAFCNTCHKPARYVCPVCEKVAYCTTQCQASSWETHCREYHVC